MHHYSPTLSMEDEVEEALDECIRQISDDAQQETDVVISKLLLQVYCRSVLGIPLFQPIAR